MGKRIISTMIVSLVAIATVTIPLQLHNFKYVAGLYNEYFETLAQRALDEISHSLEQDEVERQLRMLLTQDDMQQLELSDDAFRLPDVVSSAFSSSCMSDGSEAWNGYGGTGHATCLSWAETRVKGQNERHTEVLQSKLLNIYFYRRSLLDETVLRTILQRNNEPLRQRVSVSFLQRALTYELAQVGITEAFEFTLYGSDGQAVCTTISDRYERSLRPPLVVRKDLFASSGAYIEMESGELDLPCIEVTFPEHSRHIDTLIHTLPSAGILLVIIVLNVLVVTILLRHRHCPRERRDFVGNMTHELETPVSSIRLACEMLEDPSLEQSEERRKHITQATLKEVDRLTLLVNQVLQSSMMERSVPKSYPVELDTHEGIGDLSNVYAMKINSAHGELVLTLETEHHMFMRDRVAFQNVIFNVINSNLKHHKEDTLSIITSTIHSDNVNLIIDIKDNGIGISRQNRGHIFDQFYQIHTGDRHGVKGFGLGLAYMQRAIQAMGGEVKVSSKLGVGTKMPLRIPYLTKSKSRIINKQK